MKRVLVANRGEIALRIVRACKELALETVAVYSDADAESRHVQLSDMSLRIGPPAAKHSYLDKAVIIQAAKATGADAIHPGYGFLSEDADFAERCAAEGLIFVGPPPNSIRQMGDKIQAKHVAESIGVPLVPGGNIGIGADLDKLAKTLPYPVLLKAAAGGGGRGMRVVQAAADFATSLAQASNEAQEAFGDGTVYWETYISNARHIEVQVLSDSHGNHVHLGERDCSLQRRHQKLLEESPSPMLRDDLRADLCGAAVRIVRTLDYRGAGTIEFLFDADRQSFHFIEMNTRIQVEHPVTEQITGVDLVAEQIRIAAGEKLRFRQRDLTFRGHAIECRINAEDPFTFVPSPGKISFYHPPGGPGIRVDSHIYQGYTVPPHYDSMVAKVIAYGDTREQAIRRMRIALSEMSVEGIKTNIALHHELMHDARFVEGGTSIHYLEEKLAHKGEVKS